MSRRAAEISAAYQPGDHVWLQFDGWAGRTQQEVEFVGETPKRYRIRALAPTRLAGHFRFLATSETALVPKRALRREAVPEVKIVGAYQRDQRDQREIRTC